MRLLEGNWRRILQRNERKGGERERENLGSNASVYKIFA